MRRYWPRTWLSFSQVEKTFSPQRLACWIIRRHRLAPAVGEYPRRSLTDNIAITKGVLKHLAFVENGIAATIVQTHRTTELRIGHLINCTRSSANQKRHMTARSKI